MLQGRFSPKGLSARLFWLTVGIILLVQILVVIPSLGSERQIWLSERVSQAQVVAMSIEDNGTMLDQQLRSAMLQLSDTVAITCLKGRNSLVVQPVKMPTSFGRDIDLDQESLIQSIWRACIAVLGNAAPYARVYVTPPQAKAQIEVIISQRELGEHLRRYLTRNMARAAVLAVVISSLVFIALDRKLVRPMRVMTASIAGFRRNPGHAGLSGLKWLSGRGDDEIARAARELVAMQDELRSALWRNARLAALGTEVAKISHDLRNILTSALLVADRIHRHGDPTIRQAANTLIPAMERAVELVSRTVDFAQEGPPAVTRSPVALHELVNEVADMLRTTDGSVAINNLVPSDMVLSLDRNQIYRVLVNLLRNAVEAGANQISLRLEGIETSTAQLVITDNGPGLPLKVTANLFRPFNGSGRNGGTGLGLTIARDLIRAHGGDLVLRRTGVEGTEFAMDLSGGLPEDFASSGVIF